MSYITNRKPYFAKLEPVRFYPSSPVPIPKQRLLLCATHILPGDQVYRDGIEFVIATEEYGRHPQPWDYKILGEILTPGIKDGQKFTETEIDYLTIK